MALRREEYRDCISFGLRALKLCDKYNSDGCKSNILRVSRSLADSYNKLHMKDSVLYYYEKSIIMPVHKMDSMQNSETYIKIGDWFYSSNELDSARKYYLIANNFQSSFKSLFKLGKLAHYQNNKELNQNYLQKALKDLDQPIPKYILSEDSADMATHISDMFIRNGDYKSAFKYYKQLIPKSIVDPIKREAEEFRIRDSYNSIKYQQQKELFELGRKLKLEEQQKAKYKNLVLMAGFGTTIVILILAFISIKNKRKRDVAELSEQITSVEMKALRSQMNPHFIFNSLQSIQNFLISNKSEDANEYLLKFSKLMRLVLENSQMQDVTLKDDILALELYMQLEKLRFTKPFEYEIVVETSVDIDVDTIPPLLLQPFVENAIWHGLQSKTDSGNILIRFKKKSTC
ncbi:MAG: histidine kinase [Bacteroidetes bacterium]|nr:histidine kinase [Bacteroidota bacterium]